MARTLPPSHRRTASCGWYSAGWKFGRRMCARTPGDPGGALGDIPNRRGPGALGALEMQPTMIQQGGISNERRNSQNRRSRKRAAGFERARPAGRGAPRRLRRSSSDRVLVGVAGGLGRYFGVDPVIFRIGFVISVLFGGIGALVYLLLAVFVPTDGEPDRAQRLGGRLQSLGFWRGAGMVALAALALAGLIGLAGGAAFAVAARLGRPGRDPGDRDRGAARGRRPAGRRPLADRPGARAGARRRGRRRLRSRLPRRHRQARVPPALGPGDSRRRLPARRRPPRRRSARPRPGASDGWSG